MLNFTGNVVNPTMTKSVPLIPQQQIVVPPITIPQGFTTQTPPVVQLTARGPEAAKKIPLGPNAHVAIFDEFEDSDRFYLRETDANGADIDFGIYRYEKVEEPPAPEFLTKDEFYKALDGFAARLKEEFGNGKPICSESKPD